MIHKVKGKRSGSRQQSRSTTKTKPSNLGSKPKLFPYAQRLRYSIKNDRTLLKIQAENIGKDKGFAPDAVNNIHRQQNKDKTKFRFKSKPVHGQPYSTGYHEAFMTTDIAKKIHGRFFENTSKTTFKIKDNHPSFGNSKTEYQEGQLLSVLRASDAARTDTAGTILSAKNGLAAGHSGSKTALANQPQAHDLIREQVGNMLSNPAFKNLSPKGIAVAAAATVITSRAPGEITGAIPRIDKMKAKNMSSDWESRRNEAKSRLKAVYDTLPKKEQALIQQFNKPFFKMVSGNGYKRKMATDGSISPRRSEQKTTSFLYGGGYDGSQFGPPSEQPPADVDEYSTMLYITQPFRSNRR